jgi:exonuclease III
MAVENLLVWNVRGLNSVVHRNAVWDLVAAEWISLVCLQETKLDVISDFDVIEILGLGFDYVFWPAVHTRGDSFCLAQLFLDGGWS